MLSICSIGIGIYLLQQTSGAKAAWFNTDYTYRQRIPISNSGSSVSNFQIGFTLNTSTLITDGKMQSDCDDIKIVTENGEELPFWIEENNPGCNQTTTKIWTKIPSIPTSDINIYIYYGNPSATSAQNPNGVFMFFDDFNSSSFAGKWVGDTGSFQQVGGTLSSASSTVAMYSVGFTMTDATIEARVLGYDASAARGAISGRRSGGSGSSAYYDAGYLFRTRINTNDDVAYLETDNSTITQIEDNVSQTFADNTWYHQRFDLVGSTLHGYIDGSLLLSGTGPNYSSGNVGVSTFTNSGVAWDWFLVRKYAATPPTVGAFGSEEVTPGPISYWKFDEGYGSTTYDSSGNSNTGTLSNDPVWQSEDKCLSGRCLFFDATDDYVDTTTDLSWTTSDSFTLEMWVKPIKSGTEQGLLGKGFTSGYEYRMGINTNDKPGFAYWNTGGTAILSLTSSRTANIGEWNYIAATYNGSEAYLYLNGQLVGEDTSVSGTFQDRSTALTIGRTYWSNSNGAYFKGFIDNVRIYDYARSESEIKTNYLKAASGSGSGAVLGSNDQSFLSEGLIAYWKMDDNDIDSHSCDLGGSTAGVCDDGGSGHHGTANGTMTDSDFEAGKFGLSVDFDGTDDYFSTSGTLNTDGAITVSFWNNVATADVQASSAFGGFGTDSSSDRLVAHAPWSDSAIYFDYGHRTLGGVSTDYTNYLDKWTHIVMVSEGKSGSYTAMYLDGDLVASKNTSDGPDGSMTFDIGRAVISSTDYHQGNIDELRVYNRVLSPREVRSLYNWAPGPLAYWKMEDFVEGDGQTIVDISGNALDGTTDDDGSGNGLDCKAQGKYGGGCLLDGLDHIDIGNPTDLQLTKAVTLTGWIKVQSQPDSGTDDGLFGKYGSTGFAGYGLVFDPNTDKIDFAISDNGIGGDLLTSSTVLSNNIWYHVTGVFVPSTYLKVYINGVLDAEASTSLSSINNTTTGFRIGTFWSETTAHSFNGIIDDVKVYNYERTPRQIIQDMNAGHPLVGSPIGSPIAYWNFDEGYGSTANNSGNQGSDLNGTLGSGTSAPSWSNDGILGKSLSFDGVNDYVEMADSDLLSFGDSTSDEPFSLSAWVNVGSDERFRILTKGTSSAREYMFSTGSIEKPSLTLYDNNSSNLIQCITTSSYSAMIDTWTHIVATYDGSAQDVGINMYINGNQVQCTASTSGSYTAMHNQTGAAPIGRLFDGGATYYEGYIDELKIYSYELTEDEVKVDYNQGKAIVLGAGSSGLGGTAPGYAASSQYCPPGTTDQCDVPVGEWKFDENVSGDAQTIQDTSENTNTGTSNDGANNTGMDCTHPGVRGSSCHLDGADDYIEVADDSSLDFTNTDDFTISGWFNRLSGTTDDIIIAKRNGSTALDIGYKVWFDDSTDKLTMEVCDDTAGVCDEYLMETTQTFINNGWHHFAVVWDDDSAENSKIYIDGKDDNENHSGLISAIGDLSNAVVLRIGTESDGDHPFDGYLDDLRIYDYARTPEQVAWEYSKGAPIAHYKFDECQGTTAYNSTRTYDDAAAGNNGTINEGGSGDNNGGVGTCDSGNGDEMWDNGTTGKRGASLDFDNTDDYVSIADDDIFSFGDGTTDQPFSLSGWFNADTITTASFASDADYLVNKDNPAGGQEWAISVGATDTIRFQLHDDSASSKLDLRYSGLSNGTWYHFVTTYSGSASVSGMKVYINGKQVNTVNNSSGSYTAMENLGGNVIIGSRTGSALGFYDGQIDDVRIYNYELTAAQIRTDYNNGAVSFE